MEYVFRRNRSTTEAPTQVARAMFDEFSDEIRNLLVDHFAARATMPIRVEELPAVVNVRTLIADAVAQCPLVHLGPNGKPVAYPSPIVEQPDPYEYAWLTHNRTVMDLTGDGNVWLHVTARNTATGEPVAVTLLPANECTPIEAPRTLRPIGVRHLDRDFYIATGEVIWLPMYVTGRRNRLGESALRMSRPALEGIAELYGYARSIWTTAGVPSIVLEVPQKLAHKKEADDIRAAWTETHGGKRVPAVLSGGAKASPFGQVDDVLKLAQAVEIIAADAPNAYRVPPSLTNTHAGGGSLTYTNTADEFRRWNRLGLSAYFQRIEAVYTALLPAGHAARFDRTELLVGDPTEQAQLTQIATGGVGWLLVDEARAERGLDPIGPTTPTTPRQALPAMDGS